MEEGIWVGQDWHGLKTASELAAQCRNIVGITDPNEVFHSHRHTAISYLSDTLTPDMHPAVKEDVDVRFVRNSPWGGLSYLQPAKGDL